MAIMMNYHFYYLKKQPMDKNELAKRFFELSNEIAEKEKEKKELMAKIFTTDFQKLIIGDKQIIKVVKRPITLKEGKEEEVRAKFPEAIVTTESLNQEFLPTIKEKMPEAFNISTSLDLKVLEKNFEAAEYLEIKEKPELHIKKYDDTSF